MKRVFYDKIFANHCMYKIWKVRLAEFDCVGWEWREVVLTRTYSRVRSWVTSLFLLNTSSQAHPSIQFTIENENCQSFMFIYVTFHRRADGSIKTAIYRKKTWTGHYLRFHGNVHFKQKRNVSISLVNQTGIICSTNTILSGLDSTCNILIQNSY